MSLSNAYETHVLDWLFGAGSPPRPPGRFIALFTANPGEGGGGTEVSGGAYARQSATFAVSGDSASNTNVVEFPAATTNWGTVSHFGVYTAATGGTMIAYGALQTSRVINQDDVGRFVASTLTITID